MLMSLELWVAEIGVLLLEARYQNRRKALPRLVDSLIENQPANRI